MFQVTRVTQAVRFLLDRGLRFRDLGFLGQGGSAGRFIFLPRSKVHEFVEARSSNLKFKWLIS